MTTEEQIVDQYLKLLAEAPRRPGRRTDLEKKRASLEKHLETAEGLRRLQLISDLRELAAEGMSTIYLDLEDRFIEIARAFSETHGYTYDDWIKVGVSATVLRKAHIYKPRPKRSEVSL